MTPKPRFSVLIPAFNRQDLVRLAIDSVLAQTFSDYEIIVVDDGSTDGTVDMLRSYGSRIKLLQQPNSGAEVARSKAAAVAAGEYFVLLDSDDILYPTALATYDNVIRALHQPPVILGAMTSFSHGDEPPQNKDGDERIEIVQFRDFLSKDRGPWLSCSNLVFKASVAKSMGALRKERTAFPFDTADIMLLLGTSGPCVLILRPFTVAYRLHETNTIHRLDHLLKTAPCLAHCERLGQYPGGAARRLSRYAYIGGVVWCYASKGLKRGLFRLTSSLLLRTFPMVTVGAINSVLRRFRKPASEMTLTTSEVTHHCPQ